MRRTLVLLVCAAALVIPAGATAGGGPVITVFRAFTPAGKPALPVKSAHGYCWTGSIAAQRSDAWRCFIGNDIADPCFSSQHAAGVVLCPTPQLTLATEIQLTRALPRSMADHGQPTVRSRPWLIELGESSLAGTAGARCELVTGATSAIGGVPEAYFCTGHALASMGLWGAPAQGPGGWSIRIAPDSSTSLLHATRVHITHMWV
jgi:hypothetical protein